jgi:hypothetical protein
MMCKIIKVWPIVCKDGINAVFLTEPPAKDYADANRIAWEGDTRYGRQAVVLDDGKVAFVESHLRFVPCATVDDMERLKALAKLTDAEKKLLGLVPSTESNGEPLRGSPKK